MAGQTKDSTDPRLDAIPHDAEAGPGDRRSGAASTSGPFSGSAGGSSVRFEKRVLRKVPVDPDGTRVDSWLFIRTPLEPPLSSPSSVPRVVFVHGLGDAPVSWFPCLRTALPGCELVLPALPGAGRGPLPEGHDHLGFRATTSWLMQVVGRLVEHEGPVTVVGHSLGAWLAERVVLDDPSLASRMRPPVLVNPAGMWYEGVERERELLSPRRLEDVDELLMQIYAEPPEMPVEAMQSLLETMQDPAYRGLLGSTREEDFLREGDVERLPEGTGLVWGLEDGLIPKGAFQRLRTGLRDPRVVELADCGHAPHLEAPGRMAEVLARLVG